MRSEIIYQLICDVHTPNHENGMLASFQQQWYCAVFVSCWEIYPFPPSSVIQIISKKWLHIKYQMYADNIDLTWVFASSKKNVWVLHGYLCQIKIINGHLYMYVHLYLYMYLYICICICICDYSRKKVCGLWADVSARPKSLKHQKGYDQDVDLTNQEGVQFFF